MWKPLTIRKLKSSLLADELELFSEEGTDAELLERAPGILEDVTDHVLGCIVSFDRNKMPEDETLIPKAYHFHALAMARFRLLTALPYCEVSEDRKDENDDAIDFFKEVAKGTYRPEPPEVPRKNKAPSQKPLPGAQVVTSRKKITGRDNLSGL